MGITEDSPYLPRSRVQDIISYLKTHMAYNVWRKKLIKYLGINQHSKFTLIDFGCGPGYFLRCIEEWFPNCILYGIDVDSNLIEYAKKYLNRSILIRIEGNHMPFENNTIDVVSILQVIEHIRNPELTIKEIYRVLKSEGLLIMSTPNPSGICACVLKDKWGGFRYDHISLKPPDEWKRIVEQSGFKVLEDGTTGLSGFKIFRIPPFAFLNWLPLAVFGYFRWNLGESYMLIARKY